ncbi:MAG: DUF4191 domain-containing protein [Mycobacteriales bacterium]
MARDPKAGSKAAQPSRGKRGAGAGAGKGEAGKPKRVKGQRFEKWKQLVAAFKITRQRDRTLPLWLTLAFFGTFAVLLLVFTLIGVPLYLSVPTAVLSGVLALMIVFGRRAQKAAFAQVEGQPGAAYWVLQNMRGDWRVAQGVQVNAQLDAVHRVLGRPGVVLVGEGQPHRVRGLMAQEKKRVARIAGDTPIYDVLVGDRDGEVPIRRLNTHLAKLPRNLSQAQVNAMEKRLAALGGTKAPPLPKGPMPTRARMAGLERTLRRR